MTRTTTTTYELVETPTNANGQVKDGETIKVPYVYKKIMKQEINGGVVPNDSPVHNKPKLDIPTPEIPTPTPELPKSQTPSVETPKPKPQEKYVTKELPNTGSESSALGLLGFAGVIGSLLLLKKQKED